MVVLKVLKAVEGWNVGDEIEVEGKRWEELAAQGIVDAPVKAVEVVEKKAEEPVVKVKKSRKKVK